ncbi:beta-lactamase superfamily I metal-dependent hydrolase [Serratia marcescens]|nr:beta-lactamase superfamily I metal-dependent hydrolase [Serratia marcescens]
MQLTFLGTGGAQQVPVFGCDCLSCQRARREPAFRRRACSAMLNYQGETTLLDAGLPALERRFSAGQIQRFFTDTLPHGSRSGVISFALGVRKFHSGVWPAG